jgi:MinD superfamily P-loop ATPase
MQRVIELANHFRVPAMVCINKFDLNPDLTADIEAFAKKEGLTCLGRIPYDSIFIKAMVHGQTIFEYNTQSKAGLAIRHIWQNLSRRLAL